MPRTSKKELDAAIARLVSKIRLTEQAITRLKQDTTRLESKFRLDEQAAQR